MTQLATAADVAIALGRSLTTEETTKVEPILTKLSELFIRESGQTFVAGTSTVRLKVNGGRVFLPQRPITSVEAVRGDDGEVFEYTRVGQWLTVPLRSHEFVTVTYGHGGAIPDLVVVTIADAARQVLLVNPAAVSGATQAGTTTGPFSDQTTYAAWAQGGFARLSPEDISIARTFRQKVPTVWVQRGA